MSEIMYGEYDNYDYSSADGMTIDEQLSFMKKALNSAIEISKIKKHSMPLRMPKALLFTSIGKDKRLWKIINLHGL